MTRYPNDPSFGRFLFRALVIMIAVVVISQAIIASR